MWLKGNMAFVKEVMSLENNDVNKNKYNSGKQISFYVLTHTGRVSNQSETDKHTILYMFYNNQCIKKQRHSTVYQLFQNDLKSFSPYYAQFKKYLCVCLVQKGFY